MTNTDISGLTRQRKTVLAVIRESESHLTASDVFDAARLLLPGISYATVYNSLNYLKKEGLIGEIKISADAALYERNLTRHDHAVCTVCGKIVDLELALPAKLLEEALDCSKFRNATIDFTMRGVCFECSD